MSRYAENTSVPEDRSRSEIEKILARYGATGFMYGWQGERAIIAFEAQGRHIRFELPLPTRSDPDVRKTPSGLLRSRDALETAYQQEKRRRWRALALVVKSKLEAVETGIVTFEQEFLAHIVLPSGVTFGEWAAPQLERMDSCGDMPPLLPAPSDE